MIRFERQSNPALTIAILVSMVAVLVLDSLTPLGTGSWVFYLVPVALSLYVWRPRTPLFVAAICTALVVVGYFLSPPAPAGLSTDIEKLNRVMAVVAIWIVSIVARQFIRTKLKLREDDWIRTGQRDLSARIQGEHKLDDLGDRILRLLCEYLEVPVGVLYAVDAPGRFRRVASYALGGSVKSPEVLVPGEGLLGQAIKDKKVLRVDDLPDDWVPVSSALGQAKPRHVVAFPAQVDGEVKGAVELGFLHPVGVSDMDLLATAAEPVAIAIRAAQSRAKLEELLAETQHQAAELQVQQEELKVANEELESQSQALRDSQARLEAQQAELEQTNSQLEEQSQALERQRDDLSHAQVALVEKAEELGRINQYKSEFLANMSHELRTPLNSALILAKLLGDNKDGNLTPEQVKYAATIYTAGNDLLALINDILDLSRIEAGRVEVQPETVELAAVVDTIARSFQPVATESGLRFAVDIAPGAPSPLTTDPLRLQQILRNLLANAFKFTAAGEVALTVAAAPDGRVSFAVRDTGVGIPATQHEVIFEAFRQADGTTQRKYGGTGLGLTISRQLARRLGGDITVASAPGQGSTFRLLLPAHLHAVPAPAHEPTPAPRLAHARGPAAAPPRAAAPAAAPLRPPAIEDDRDGLKPGEKAILVIEDDVAFARIVRDIAREQRFRCLVATTAGEGIELAERFVPSATILDVKLPDGSGLAVLEHLKRHAATRHIPVHVISVDDYTQQALELGAIGFAIKPLMREQLVQAFLRLEAKLEQTIRRVLVVEDVAVQRESIVALLTTTNVEVVPVGTAGEALARLKEHTFDAMVLDLKLPDMSGYELLDKMAAGEAFSFPPVIVYTGRALSHDDELRLRRHASSIIIKGVRSPERLLDEVTLFLHQVEKELPPEQQRILREVRSREAALEGRTILVVEDDVRNVFALSSLLEPKGAKLRIARNGREALAALDQAARDPAAGVDLVLMDIMMPEMDGITATLEIRKRPEWKKLPIIALTAKAMPDDRARCLQAGANDYIAKPLDVDKLISLIKVWMPK